MKMHSLHTQLNFFQLGETALHHAAWEGNVAVGEQLLEAGANPDSRERVRETK